RREPYGATEGLDIPPAALVLAVVKVDLDVAIVDIATSEGRLDDGCILYLAVLVGGVKHGGKSRKEVVGVQRALPGAQHGRVCQRGVQAVHVPKETTGAARNNGPI